VYKIKNCEISGSHGGEYEDDDVVSWKLADVSEVRTASIIRAIAQLTVSETSVNSY
jgi:hypothetical protein